MICSLPSAKSYEPNPLNPKYIPCGPKLEVFDKIKKTNKRKKEIKMKKKTKVQRLAVPAVWGRTPQAFDSFSKLMCTFTVTEP